MARHYQFAPLGADAKRTWFDMQRPQVSGRVTRRPLRKEGSGIGLVIVALRLSRIASAAETDRLPVVMPEDAELQEGKTQPDQGQHGVEILVALIQQEIKQEDGQAEHGQKDFRLDGLIIQRIEECVPH